MFEFWGFIFFFVLIPSSHVEAQVRKREKTPKKSRFQVSIILCQHPSESWADVLAVPCVAQFVSGTSHVPKPGTALMGTAFCVLGALLPWVSRGCGVSAVLCLEFLCVCFSFPNLSVFIWYKL